MLHCLLGLGRDGDGNGEGLRGKCGGLSELSRVEEQRGLWIEAGGCTAGRGINVTLRLRSSLLLLLFLLLHLSASLSLSVFYSSPSLLFSFCLLAVRQVRATLPAGGGWTTLTSFPSAAAKIFLITAARINNIEMRGNLPYPSRCLPPPRPPVHLFLCLLLCSTILPCPWPYDVFGH